MILLPIQFTLISCVSLATTFTVYSVPILKFMYEFTFLTLQISKMMLSVSSVWLWEIATNTEIVDAFAIILSVVISTSVLLDMFSYEIVFTFNSNNIDYEQNIDLN
ncbi:hypothetical protein GCK72_001983 [Caenorhabditis remanei]|uniref:Uncharacterized protein n=1 Tax=Caenorhabditis remanei TaxID=31234 RepID=A0A6A5HRC2_CAERE|nr:hypothetical protein GCK72_001983 [Caenorhabditis remanei]KAF1770165.1 hypothetical protein GCK72_001983 [Caenorhabditis remanei]